MTDNRTTELREKLTERGIEYEINDYMGVCETSWNGFTAMQLTPGAKLMMAFTPEQAIAATLGSGALAIEQIKDAVLKNFHYDRLKPPLFDWQAIADELNAELVSGTCEWTLAEKWPNTKGDDHVYGYETECGHRHTWWPESLPNFCPSCGKQVRKVVSA